MSARRSRPSLREYRAKRAPSRTPEPFGDPGSAAPGLFVVQHHASRRDHYDLRLEWGGVLKSWAVPRGPTLNPEDRRLAVRVEDHPIEYAGFEDVIPEGQYGAGAVLVWDRGHWIPSGDPEAGLRKGELRFELRGHKLRGGFALVRTRRGERDWLLVKKRDAFARPEDAGDLPPESVLSGRTLEEVREGRGCSDEIRRALEELGAPRRPVDPTRVKVMLAVPSREPFSAPGWLFELKHDGARLLASRDGGRVRLGYRSGADATALYPGIARALRALPCRRLVLDGEVVAQDERGRSDFGRLQKRLHLSRRTDVARAEVEIPVTAYFFDLLGFEDFDLRPLPLRERKRLLRRLLPRAGPLRYSDHIEERGEDFYGEVRRHDLEGILAKRADSPYQGRRSPDWRKIRVEHTDDFVIAGFRERSDARGEVGALHLAGYDGATLRYAGKVGTGFDARQRRALCATLAPLVRPTPPCADAPRTTAEDRWVEPRQVCEVRYREITRDGRPRQPVFERLREDKPPDECALPGARVPPPPPPAREPEAPPRRVELKNPEKVFWPGEGYTKGDLFAYYREIAPRLLPYLRDRPVVLDRYPDGIEAAHFFQKNAPDHTPPWVRTVPVRSESGGGERRYVVCDDLETLLYLVNLGTIPLHVFLSRAGSLERPDWCLIDLDPKGASFADVVAVARAVRGVCREIRLPCGVKTSGGKGLHVLLPLERRLDHGHARALAQLIARVVVQRVPDRATTVRRLAEQHRKVNIDCGQNALGQLMVAPYSVRPHPGAPVSTPLRWREVGARLRPERHTIRSVPARVRRMREDPLRRALDASPDLAGALERLEERL